MKKHSVNSKLAMFLSNTSIAILFAVLVILLEKYLFHNSIGKNTILTYLAIILSLSFIEMKIMEIFQKRQMFPIYFDPLTNLWTRQHFEEEATKQLKASPKAKFMLIEADIRGFKFINQTYGEEAGDKLIVYYSKIINHFAEKFHGIIGRGFADRFYILLKVSSVQNAMNEFKTNIEI